MTEPIRIAVVEDDDGLNELIRRRLEREGHRCFQLKKASEALDWFASNKADLMILDLVLPDASGDQLVSALQSKGVSIPFIVATGQGSETMAVKMLKQGARDYLVKNSGFLDALPTTVEMVWREVQLESLLAKARDRIRVQNATLSAINDFAPDGILAVDPEGKVLSFNTPLLSAFGLSEKDMEKGAKSIFSLIAAKTADPGSFLSTVASIAPSFKGLAISEIQSGQKFFELFCSPISYPDSPVECGGRIWFFHDFTLHKKAEEQMLCAKLEAENNTRMRSRFFAIVSHDVKTPLNSVNGFASLLETTELDGRQKEFVSVIKSSCAHLLVLINDILDLTRIEHGSMDLHYQELSPKELVNDCVNTFVPASNESGVPIKIEIGEGLPETIVGDLVRLRQVLTNILGNAMKFTRKGCVTVRCHPDARSLFIDFEVSDTGIGIAKDVQKFLFEPFAQANSSIAQRFGGSGLGLAISKQLVEKMGGKLFLESEEGQGATFRFSVPVNPDVAHLPERDGSDRPDETDGTED